MNARSIEFIKKKLGINNKSAEVPPRATMAIPVESQASLSPPPPPLPSPSAGSKGMLTEEIINGLLKGSLAGVFSPLATIPLDNSNTNKLLRPGQEKTSLWNFKNLMNLYKRLYPFSVLTTTLKNGTVFILRPGIKTKLEQQGLSAEKSNQGALVLAGLGEGGVISALPAVLKQKMQLDSSIRTPYQAWSSIPREKRGMTLRAASVYGGLGAAVFWSFFMPFRDKGEEFLDANNKAAPTGRNMLIKQFGVGAGAGWAACAISYPLFGYQKRGIDKPEISAWQQTKTAVNNFGLRAVSRFFYAGFIPAGCRVPVGWGIANLAFHAADNIQEKAMAMKKS